MAKTNEVTVIDADEPERGNERALALAKQVGYEGSLTVGALEDEIRFYQRQTVEACLELGKRLLVLRELTPHGEFSKRCEQLGFCDERTRLRFMNAAARTAKSGNLPVLATQVKSMSAFLELVTLDDDTLAELSEMDDIDRLSASQLRQRVRELEDKGTKAEESLAEQLNDTEAQLEARKLELERMVRGEGLHLLSRYIRAEAVANASVVQAACDDLLRLWRACDGEAVSEVDANMRRRAVAMAVSGAMAHVASVLATVGEEFGEPMPMMPGAMDELTSDERTAAQASAARLQEQLQDVRQRRRSEAYEEHLLAGGAPKRGRPEGSKTKDKSASKGKK